MMEEEKFFSGYCRQTDGSRMVEVLLEAGNVTEVDCGYDCCIYRETCPIGKEIGALAP